MYEYSATVVNIVDGDTIDVTIDLGFYITIKERVRFAGIDAYETKLIKGASQDDKNKGLEAKVFLHELINNKNVKLQTIKQKDKYGRFLAIVFLNDANINDILLEKGFAIKT
jgi:micrococcal nuclease